MAFAPRAIAVLVLTYFGASSAGFGSRQDWRVAYTATQLQCSRFLEEAQSRIETETAGRVRHQISDRRGLWQFRAKPEGNQVALEGWLDSLTLSRQSDEATVTPDTDGLLGGRYRGTLTSTGRYARRVSPFVPDEVAEVAGMATALDDFFPPLPSVQLQVGKAWTPSPHLTIRRLSDSALSGLPLFRFEIERRTEAGAVTPPGDSVSIPVRQVTEERATFVWHPILGVIRQERSILVRANVPVSRSVRQPVRSKVEQQITVTRDLTGDPTKCRAPV